MTGDLWRTCLCSKFDLNGVLWADFLHGRAQYVTKWVRLSRICVTVTRNRFSSYPAWPAKNLRSKWYSTILNFGEGSSQNRTSRYPTWPQTGHIRTSRVSYLLAQMTKPVRKNIQHEGPFLSISVRHSILPFGVLPGVLYLCAVMEGEQLTKQHNLHSRTIVWAPSTGIPS